LRLKHLVMRLASLGLVLASSIGPLKEGPNEGRERMSITADDNEIKGSLRNNVHLRKKRSRKKPERPRAEKENVSGGKRYRS